MTDIPEIEPSEGGGGGVAPVAAAAIAATALCLSCATPIAGVYCATCGQRNDDMRRSSFVLFKDFIKDTFAFDSRMWRTLGLMAAAPGAVPSNYSHGRRSRYTPPVRLFLVVSFLFFLVLGLTHTMFVAFDVEALSPAQIAARKERASAELKEREEALRAAGAEVEEAIAAAREAVDENGAVVIDGEPIDCDINVKMRFFVRPEDLNLDAEKWRACAASIARAAKVEVSQDPPAAGADGSTIPVTEEDIKRGFDRVLAGVNTMVANPIAFNSDVNTWLPRIMFLMAPILALIMALFLRGRDALLFDHLVLSLYSHAAAFAIIGVAIVLGQFGVAYVFPGAMAALGLYFILALKRAYRRGWIKTIYSATFVGVIYLLVLTSVVGSIIANQIWRAAA